MKEFKEPLKLGAILGIIALVIAVMLSFVNSITADKIQKANEDILQDGLRKSMPAAHHFIPMEGADLTNSYNIRVDKIYLAMDEKENVIGYCATVFPSGYGGEIETVVGMDTNMVVTGVEVTANMSETAGLGAKVQEKKVFNYQFEKEKAPFAVTKDGGKIDAITSATVTSRAVTNGVNAAAEVIEKNQIYGELNTEGEIVNGIFKRAEEQPVEPKPEDADLPTEGTEEGNPGGAPEPAEGEQPAEQVPPDGAAPVEAESEVQP